jgi:hypothetical protein
MRNNTNEPFLSLLVLAIKLVYIESGHMQSSEAEGGSPACTRITQVRAR